MINKNEKSGLYAGILFLIWPLLSLVSAFRNYKSPWAKNILWAFVAFYGITFAVGVENSSSDIVRYRAQFEELYHREMTFSGALDYYRESGEIDILRTVLAITVSRFTYNKLVITLIYGIIFGYFFSRNMWFVLRRLEGKIKPISIFLFLCFFMVVPIWEFNGFRMYTATHMFIYGLLLFLFDQKKSGLFISIATIAVHFSFLVPVGILLGYLILGNRLIIYFTFLIITLFVSEVNIDSFNNIVENYAPEIVQERTSSYRSEARVEQFRENTSNRNWYVVWYGKALKWSLMGFMIVLFLKGRDFFRNNREWLNLFSFTLLFYGFANLFSSLPSGGRYNAVANLCSMALVLLYVQNREQEKTMKRFVIVAAPALLLYLIVEFRIGLYSTSFTTLFGNPLIAIILEGNFISLNDVMKSIL